MPSMPPPAACLSQLVPALAKAPSMPPPAACLSQLMPALAKALLVLSMPSLPPSAACLSQPPDSGALDLSCPARRDDEDLLRRLAGDRLLDFLLDREPFRRSRLRLRLRRRL